MIFVAHALDKPASLPKRLAAIEAHRSYLESAPAQTGVVVLMSGPLVQDDGKAMKGSFFLLKASSRESVEKLFAGDPMAKAGVWQELRVNRANIRQNNVGPLGENE